MKYSNRFSTLIYASLLLLLCGAVHSEPGEDHWFSDLDTPIWLAIAEAREQIEAGNYTDALISLKTLEQEAPKNAEIHNLLGYALRKTGELEQSQSSYKTALMLNPNHKGALEYQGELYLTLGQENEALSNLEKLQQLCPSGCEELADLELEIAQWRANN